MDVEDSRGFYDLVQRLGKLRNITKFFGDQMFLNSDIRRH
jgi:hypothetical protein